MENPVVETNSGPVKGKIYTTHYGNDVFAFQRIPYMKPPVGKLRFKDPEPADNWTEVFDGTQDISLVAQNDLFMNKFSGGEAELYINVFTRNLKPTKLQPVVISIHGGGFIGGSSSNEMFGPDNILQDDIVFFSFNYRLAVLGFLSFDDPNVNVPGNAGLKDQTLALKWIKKNAECFGGDPNNITLMGLSAGGASVHYHLISDMSRDLFHKAIVMSGAALNSWAGVPNKQYGLRLAKKFGWVEKDGISKALEILQNLPVEELAMAQDTIITKEEKQERIYAAFVPLVEPYISEQCFLPEPLVNMIPKQWSRNIPIIIGATTHEANMLWAAWEKIKDFPEGADYIGDFKYLIPFELGLDRNSDECKKLGNLMKSFYFGGEVLNFRDKQTLTKYLDLMSDKLFVYGVYAAVKSRVDGNNSPAPTYLYRFNYFSEVFDFKKMFPDFGVPLEGVGHGADLGYIYSTMMYRSVDKESPEWDKVKQISSMFIQFIKTGNPNSALMQPTIWTPVATDSVDCLNIADDLEMIVYPELDRVNFWHDMFKKYVT